LDQEEVGRKLIKPESNNSALYALHLILVRARFLVLQRESLDDVAVLLDYAEAMPRMFVSEEDETAMYRDDVSALSDQIPYCRYILEQFDAPEPPSNW
jgi:hypothetical protein